MLATSPTRCYADRMEPPYRVPVAAEVRAHMARRAITSAELARRLGQDPGWVRRRVSGRPEVALNVDELGAIACVLGVTPAELLPAPRCVAVPE